MAEQSSQEPTMEEILASIRRIISEDEAPESKLELPAEEEPAPARSAEPSFQLPEAEPEARGPQLRAVPSADEEDEDALELTDRVETHGDLDVYTPNEPPPPEPEPPRPPPASSLEPEEGLVSAPIAAAAASAFGRLSQRIQMPAEGRTLEDVVRELLRPLLQQWLDDHLPGIVQAAVEAEVERIARGGVR
jgi:cell pole-organizing protein PopZ